MVLVTIFLRVYYMWIYCNKIKVIKFLFYIVPADCNELDVALLLDMGGPSCGDVDTCRENFFKLASFAQELAEEIFSLGDNNQMAVVTFAAAAAANLVTGFSTDVNHVTNTIDQQKNLFVPLQESHIHLGFDLAVSDLFSGQDREDVQDLIILLTAGKPSDPDAASIAAATARVTNITVLVLGTPSRSDFVSELSDQYLRDYASDPKVILPNPCNTFTCVIVVL